MDRNLLEVEKIKMPDSECKETIINILAGFAKSVKVTRESPYCRDRRRKN